MPPELLNGVLLPAGVAFVVMVIIARPWRVEASKLLAVGTSLALMLGFMAAFAVLYGIPKFPPSEFWQWICYLAIPIAGLGMLRDWSRLPCIVQGVALVVVAVVFAYGIVPGFSELDDSRNLWRGIAALCLIVLRLGAGWGFGRMDARFAMVLLVLLASGAAGFLIVAHTARFAQVCGVLASVSGAGLVLSLWRPSAVNAGSAARTIASMLLAVALVAMFYDDNDVSHAAFICVGMAPVCAALALAITRKAKNQILRAVLTLVLVLAPIGVAIALAWTGGESGGSGEYDYYDSY